MTAETTNDVNRRNVLKMTGAAAVGSVAASGTASAHVARCVSFDECSYVEATGDLPGTYTVHLLDSSGTCTTATVSGDGSQVTYSASGGSSILALEVDGTVHCNPNNCANAGLNKCGITCDETGRSGRQCLGGGAPTRPVFCGCGQVCACGDVTATVIVAKKRGGEFEADTFDLPLPGCGTPGQSPLPGGKIVAIRIDGTLYANPNNCAKKAQEALGISRMNLGEKGGSCGNGFLQRCD